MTRFVPAPTQGSHGSRGGSPVGEWMEAVEKVYGPYLRGVGDLWTRALDPAAWVRPARGKHCDECGQEQPACDRCACEICDADLAVMAYPGELRLFPITVENTRSHERVITAEISDWVSSRGDKADWPTRVTPPRFVLPPCSEKTIGVRVHIVDADVIDDKDKEKEREAVVAAAAARARPAQPVDSIASIAAYQPPVSVRPIPTPVVPEACAVYYADLRLAGCDIRPIRLAVALLPPACGAYLARCGCCC